MRGSLLVLLALAVVTSFAVASAANLDVRSGALQSFDLEIERPPDPPEGVSADPQPAVTPAGRFSVAIAGAVQVSWLENDPEDDVTEYRVYRSASFAEGFSQVGSSSGSSYTDNDVEEGETYLYYVTAVNHVGESVPSDEASASLPLDCDALDAGSDAYAEAVAKGDCPELTPTPTPTPTAEGDEASLGVEEASEDATPEATSTPEPTPTGTPFPTRGPQTPTAVPSATPVFTPTPVPTDTPEPTPSPEPTATEAPATPDPDPTEASAP